ncbi:MAG: acetate uptake transporter [Bacteroidales bacterium]|nr:acetate uptake transporter [Bacteroidales bacterium]MDD4149785.1 acetate uptake transporter [Bacteroidales bacterium]
MFTKNKIILMQENSQVKIIDSSSNPAPLGLLGFGLTTILLNLANAEITNKTSVIIAMGIFVGGLAQVIAGILESKKNNTFGMTAFIAYGFFWISLVGIWVFPSVFDNCPQSIAPTHPELAWYLLLWGIFSFGMFIGTFKISRALQIVFGSLVVLFILLALANFTGSHIIHIIAGYEGIFCGLTAVYTSIAGVINELYGKELMPVRPVKK